MPLAQLATKGAARGKSASKRPWNCRLQFYKTPTIPPVSGILCSPDAGRLAEHELEKRRQCAHNKLCHTHTPVPPQIGVHTQLSASVFNPKTHAGHSHSFDGWRHVLCPERLLTRRLRWPPRQFRPQRLSIHQCPRASHAIKVQVALISDGAASRSQREGGGRKGVGLLRELQASCPSFHRLKALPTFRGPGTLTGIHSLKGLHTRRRRSELRQFWYKWASGQRLSGPSCQGD